MFSTIKKVIDLIDWGRKLLVKIFKNTKEFFKRRRANKIRHAVDKHDTHYIDAVVRNIKKRRRDRRDSS